MPGEDTDYGYPMTVITEKGQATVYDTVLGYMQRNDGLRLLAMADPVHETVALGREAVRLCKVFRLTTMSVAAPKAITIRYPKIERVKAYPVSILAQVFAA